MFLKGFQLGWQIYDICSEIKFPVVFCNRLTWDDLVTQSTSEKSWILSLPCSIAQTAGWKPAKDPLQGGNIS